MGQTQLDLYNRVLTLTEGECLPDLTRTRPEKLKLDAIWEQDRDALLRDYPWNFATRRTCDLTAYKPKQSCGFAHAYALPDDFIVLYWVTDEENSPRIAIEAVEIDDPANSGTTTVKQALVSDQANPEIRYVYRAPLEAFDPVAFEALAAKIAMTFALSHSAKADRYNHARDHFNLAMRRAKHIDAKEGTRGSIKAGGWGRASTNYSGRRRGTRW